MSRRTPTLHQVAQAVKSTDLEASGFQRRPAYRYIRATDRLPSVDEARAAADPILRVKLFNPAGRQTWYIAGYDPETRIAWGVVDILVPELGTFWMRDLVELRVGIRIFGKTGYLPIERDLSWEPVPLSAVLIPVSKVLARMVAR